MVWTVSSVVPLVAGVAYSALLWIVLQQRLRRRELRWFAAYLFCMAAWSFCSWATRARVAWGSTLFWNRAMAIWSTLAPVTSYGFVQSLLGKKEGGWFWTLMGIYVLGCVAAIPMGLLVAEAHMEGERLIVAYGPLSTVIGLGWLAWLLGAMGMVVRAWRRSDGEERRQLGFLVGAIALILLGAISNATQFTVYPVDVGLNAVAAGLLTYAVGRWRLLNLRESLRRTSAAALTFTGAVALGELGVYVLLLLWQGGLERWVWWVPVGVAAVIVLLNIPAKRILEAWVDQLLFPELHRLDAIARRLGQMMPTAGLEEIGKVLEEGLREALDLENVCLFIREETGEYRAITRNELFLAPDHPLVLALEQRRAPLDRASLTSMPIWKAIWKAELDELQILGGEQFLLLEVQGRLVGILVLGARRHRKIWEPWLIDTIQSVIGQIAVRVEHARLFSLMDRRVRELLLLREASLHVAEGLSLESVLDRIARTALEIVNATDVHLFLYDAEQDRLEYGASAWAEGVEAEPFREVRPDGLTATVARSGKPLIIDRAQTHPLFRDQDWGIFSIAGFPIRRGDRVVGVLNVAFIPPRHFTREERWMLEMLCDHAALAIENARLIRDLEDSLRQLKLAQAQLLRSAKLASLGDLVAGVAHELNNPLTAIVGYGQLMLMDSKMNAEDRHDVERILDAAYRCQRIVQNLLTFARQYTPSTYRFDLNEAIERTVELLGYSLRKENIEVVMALDPDLPLITADRDQIQQVILNLVVNAREALAKVGGGRLTLRSMRAEQSFVRFCVEDTGPGIPEEVRNRIFDPFFTTKKVGEGPGLGLSICYGIVQEHQGSIWVESEEGKGARFWVKLPIAGPDKEKDRSGDTAE